MNVQHLTIDELADAAEGLLDPERAAFVDSHIADCPDCQAQSDALREVAAAMHAEPTLQMPEPVARRLNDVRVGTDQRRTEPTPVFPGLGLCPEGY